MKKILVIILAILFTIAFSTPAFADTPAGGKPAPEANYPLILNEPIVPPAIWIAAYANPDDTEITRHIVKPNGKGSTEDSWFEITSFDGYIIFYPAGLFSTFNVDINDYFADSASYTDINSNLILFAQVSMSSDIKVTFHQGTQANKPLITIHSSGGIDIPPSLSSLTGGLGPYHNIIIMGFPPAKIHAN